jgi:hypothetical protein
MAAARRRAFAIATVIVAALAIGGCSSLGQLQDESAKTDIARVITLAFTTNDPAACDLASPRFLALITHPYAGQSPLEACREDARDSDNTDAESVSFDSIVVGERLATATFSLTGGTEDGSVVTLQMVDDNGWKLDTIVTMRIDRPRWLAAQRAQLGSVASGTRPVVGCLLDYVDEHVPTAAIDQALATQSYAFMIRAIPACQRQIRTMVVAVFRVFAAHRGASFVQAHCIASRIEDALRPIDLRQSFIATLVDHEPFPPAVWTRAAHAAEPCGPLPGPPPAS